MKLLLDENLSPRLVKLLSDLYPGSSHVCDLLLERATDHQIWEYARANGFAIVSKDSDFEQRSILEGHPPKVVWVRLGNCSTSAFGELLRKYSPVIHTFDLDSVESILVLP